MSEADSNRSDSDLKPIAVSIPVARKLLGDKARGPLYDAIGEGRLEALKDGGKTLITMASIERYMTTLPPAKIKPPAPRVRDRKARRRKNKNAVRA